MNGWVFFGLFVFLIGTFAFAIWFNGWLEEKYDIKDEWDRQVDNSEHVDKLEPRE